MRLYEPPSQEFLTEEQCTAKLAYILNTSKKVATIIQAIQILNPKALKRGVTCRQCSGTIQQDKMGYYDGTYKKIVLCCDNLKSTEQIHQTLVHELIHAFDACRKGKFTSICHLIACGEIRASSIGQCSSIQPEHKKRACVFRDATQSTQLHCGDQASKIVQEVFENCMKDGAPFSS